MKVSKTWVACLGILSLSSAHVFSDRSSSEPDDADRFLKEDRRRLEEGLAELDELFPADEGEEDSAEDPIDRVLNVVPKERYDYMAYIGNSSDFEEYCGGFLISKNVVLSDAKCRLEFVEEGREVFLGVHDRSASLVGPFRDEHYEKIPVKETFVHPLFYTRPEYSIMVVILEWDSKFDPVCMFSEKFNKKLNLSSDMPLFAISYGGVAKIRELVMRNLNLKECNRLMKAGGHQISYKERMCTSATAVTQERLCNEDTGSPLIKKGHERRYDIAMGVFSHMGDDSCERDPMVFSRLSYAYFWIKGYVQKAGGRLPECEIPECPVPRDKVGRFKIPEFPGTRVCKWIRKKKRRAKEHLCRYDELKRYYRSNCPETCACFNKEGTVSTVSRSDGAEEDLCEVQDDDDYYWGKFKDGTKKTCKSLIALEPSKFCRNRSAKAICPVTCRCHIRPGSHK